jgi:small neutral amino acid transporter SnatA (MarC family)
MGATAGGLLAATAVAGPWILQTLRVRAKALRKAAATASLPAPCPSTA